HAWGCRDAVPLAKTFGDPPAIFVLHEDVEKPVENEEYLLDLVGMRRVALSRLDVHDAEREAARRDRARVAVLARAARTDETVLGALVALDLGIFERGPVRFSVGKSGNVLVHDLFQARVGEFCGAGMACSHGGPPQSLVGRP